LFRQASGEIRYRTDRDARRLVKGGWWLLRKRETVTREADQVRLRELLAANRALICLLHTCRRRFLAVQSNI